MSLTSFVQEKDVAAKLKLLRLAPVKPRSPLRVIPRTNRFGLVGTAFDYVLRFELQRRAPYALSREWVAEAAIDRIWHKADGVTVVLDLFAGTDNRANLSTKQVVECARAIVSSAKKQVDQYAKLQHPTLVDKTCLAEHAIRLAKVEIIYRTLIVDDDLEAADSEDVADVVAMLDIVPCDDLLDDSVIVLNPAFGGESLAIGGADADLISGSRLIDVKTTKNGEIRTCDRDQLLGYFLLARRHRQENLAFPEIDQVGVYFARHGERWTTSTDVWTKHAKFDELESWFFERAASGCA